MEMTERNKIKNKQDKESRLKKFPRNVQVPSDYMFNSQIEELKDITGVKQKTAIIRIAVSFYLFSQRNNQVNNTNIRLAKDA